MMIFMLQQCYVFVHTKRDLWEGTYSAFVDKLFEPIAKTEISNIHGGLL